MIQIHSEMSEVEIDLAVLWQFVSLPNYLLLSSQNIFGSQALIPCSLQLVAFATR